MSRLLQVNAVVNCIFLGNLSVTRQATMSSQIGNLCILKKQVQCLCSFATHSPTPTPSPVYLQKKIRDSIKRRKCLTDMDLKSNLIILQNNFLSHHICTYLHILHTSYLLCALYLISPYQITWNLQCKNRKNKERLEKNDV